MTSPELTRRLSDEIEAWLKSPGHKRLGDLVEVFGKRSFAIAFVLLLALSNQILELTKAIHASTGPTRR